jgi:hypothetical protein
MHRAATLHEAMRWVLEEAGGWMHRDDIAELIAREGLWVRPSDGQPPPSDQIRLRAGRYADQFECSDTACTRIHLRSSPEPPTVQPASTRAKQRPSRSSNMTDQERQSASHQRESAASRYKPGTVDLLLVAESPPTSLDRYFYFEDVQAHDSLFRCVVRTVLEIEPTREKAEHLAALRDAGLFLIDLRPDSLDARPAVELLDGLLVRVRALEPRSVVLIKVTVFDLAYRFLQSHGISVAPQRIPFPGSGQQKRFEALMKDALSWCRGRLTLPETSEA